VELKERMRVIVSVAASFLLVTFLVQNYRHQRETDQRLTEMRKIVQASVNDSATAGSVVPANIHERGSLDDTVRIRDPEEILNKGWKLVNQRSPEQNRRAVRHSTPESQRIRPMPTCTTALAARF